MVVKEIASAAGSGLMGFLAGSIVAQKSLPKLEYQFPFETTFDLMTKEVKVSNFEFTYYYDDHIKGAFQRIAIFQMEALRKRGYKVRPLGIRECLSLFRRDVPIYRDIAIVHPFFSPPDPQKALGFLYRRHDCITGFDVADTTHLSPSGVKALNDPRLRLLCLPSTFSVWSYRISGVMNRLAVIPHGVSETFTREHVEPKNEEIKRLREIKKKKLLYFGLHSVATREAGDVVKEVVTTL